MWQPAVGTGEIILLTLVASALWMAGGQARRLALGIVPCFVAAIAVTPADPASMLVVGMALSIAFLFGVWFAPQLRRS